MRTTAEYCQAGNKRRVRGKQDTIYLDEQPGMGHLKGFTGLWISLRWRAQDEGSPKVALHPVNSHLNGFWPVLDDPSLVMVTRPRLMKTHTGRCGEFSVPYIEKTVYHILVPRRDMA